MAWDAKKLCMKLKGLCQLDIDAVRAYKQALLAIDVPIIHERLERFQQDHRRHIADLSRVIRSLGEDPPENAPDLKGFFLAGFTAIRSMTGTAGALKAMRGNEVLTNKTYEEALSWDLPRSVRELIERNFEDEVLHLAYIKKAIQERLWEGPARGLASDRDRGRRIRRPVLREGAQRRSRRDRLGRPA